MFPAFDFTLLTTLDILTCFSIYEKLEDCACAGWDWDTLPACRPDTTFLSEWRKTINFTQMVIGQKSCFFSNSSCLRWKPISTLHLFSAQKSLNRAEEKTRLQTNIGKLQNPSFTFINMTCVSWLQKAALCKCILINPITTPCHIHLNSQSLQNVKIKPGIEYNTINP